MAKRFIETKMKWLFGLRVQRAFRRTLCPLPDVTENFHFFFYPQSLSTNNLLVKHTGSTDKEIFTRDVYTGIKISRETAMNLEPGVLL